MGNSATLGETESPSVADKSGISKAASAGATSIKSLTGATESLSFLGGLRPHLLFQKYLSLLIV